MTSGAKRVTKGAISSNPGSAPPVTMPSRDIRVFLDGLAKLGYDSDALLGSIGLRRTDIDDPDAHVPCESYGAILGRATELRPTSNLAARIAAVTPIGAYPLLDFIAVTSDTVGEALRQLARYFRLSGSPISLEVHDSEYPRRVIIQGPGEGFGVEFTAALTLLHLREETGGAAHVEYLSFTHRPDNVPELELLLNCTIHAGAEWSGLAFSPENWAVPLRRRDAVLHKVLESHAADLVAQAGEADPVASAVQRALASRVGGRDTRIAAVARDLATATRTLQRRLAAAGFSYQVLLDQARKNAAESYLADRTLSISELTYLLGYSEPSAFHRAFKRWHGTTPEAFRTRLFASTLSGRISSPS